MRSSYGFFLLLIAATASAQVEPHAGQWKTWVLSSGSQMRLPPPPDSSSMPTELQAVRAAMAAADTNALAKVAFWDAGDPAYQ